MDLPLWYLKENKQQLFNTRDNIVLHSWRFDRLDEDHNQAYNSWDNISSKANEPENVHPPHSIFFYFLNLLLINF